MVNVQWSMNKTFNSTLLMFNVQRRRGRELEARTKWQCSMFNVQCSMFKTLHYQLNTILRGGGNFYCNFYSISSQFLHLIVLSFHNPFPFKINTLLTDQYSFRSAVKMFFL